MLQLDIQRFGQPERGSPGATYTRLKSEVLYTGISLAIGTSPLNIVTALKTLTPASGTLLPFFTTVGDKLVVASSTMSVNFKLNLTGIWSSSSNRSINLTFVGTQGNSITVNRNAPIGTSDIMSFATFLSPDPGEFLVTNGSVVQLQASGGTFTVSQVLLIAEQLVQS